MAVPTIPAAEAKKLIDAGARLVDIRSADEFARAHATGAVCQPVDSLTHIEGEGPIVFLCKSGMRTAANAAKLEASHSGDTYCVEGGLDGWRMAGLPVEEDASQPIEIMRQVQITAGLLVLTGVTFGFLVHPGWFGLAAFVGAGLTFSGASGWCGMAHALALMPWNRRAAA